MEMFKLNPMFLCICITAIAIFGVADAKLDPRTGNCTDVNEVFKECGPSCGGDGCFHVTSFIECEPSCLADCFCKCGYYRDYDSDRDEYRCVLGKDCYAGVVSNLDYAKVCPGHQCQGEYEYYTQSNSCLDRCRGIPGDILPKCGTQPQHLTPGCYCLPGFKRNPHTQKCIFDYECKDLAPPKIIN